MTASPASADTCGRDFRRAAGVGLAANAGLVLLKLLAGWAGNSKALVADAVNHVSDLASGLALLLGFRYWSAPPDDCHPHGHRRLESLVAGGIGLSIACVGVWLCHDAISTWTTRHDPPGVIALVAALLSSLLKEALYRWTCRAGQRIRSTALLAYAWDHRSDAIGTLPIAASAAVCLVRPDWMFVDHIAALIVCVFLFRAAAGILVTSFRQLLDAGASAADRQRILDLCLATEGVRSVHAIRSRYIGPSLSVDLHAEVDAELTVREGHAIAAALKHRLLAEGPDVIDVVVHIEPADGAREGRA